MVRSFTAVLLLAAPLTAAWIFALLAATLGAATYFLPLALGVVILGAGLLFSAAAGERWALLALLFFTAVLLNIAFRAREIGIEPGLDAQNGVKVVTWLLLLGVAALNWRRLAPVLSDSAMALYGAFAVVGLLSAAWSAAPLLSGGSALGQLAYIGFACLVAREAGERTICATLTFGLAIYLAANWIAAAAIPDFAFSPFEREDFVVRFQGIAGHPNQLAKQAAVFLLLVIAARRRDYLGRRTGWALLALGFVTLHATYSRTALLAVLLAWALVALRSRRFLLAATVGGLVLLGLAALAGSTGRLLDVDAAFSGVSRSGDADEILTLTGRTELWGFVWAMIQKSPFVGYGFNASEPILAQVWFGAKDVGIGAHNSLLQGLFTVGLVGTAPVLAAFAVLVQRWFTRPNALRDLFVLYVLISGQTEVEIFTLPGLLTLVTLLAMALDACKRLGEPTSNWG